MDRFRIIKQAEGWLVQQCEKGKCTPYIKYRGTKKPFYFSNFDSALDALSFEFKSSVILESRKHHKGDLI